MAETHRTETNRNVKVPEFLREPLTAAQARLEHLEVEAQRVLRDLMDRGRASRKDIEQMVHRLSQQDWSFPEMRQRLLGQASNATLAELERAYGGAQATYQNGEYQSAIRTLYAIVDDLERLPEGPEAFSQWVRALLRRGKAGASQAEILRSADLEIDLQAHTVRRSGETIELTPTEVNLLASLAAQPGRVFKRSQLLEKLQGISFEGYERTIDAHIKNLRIKIEADPKKPRYIETVFGVGYRFIK